jgi:23S rRNA (cytosine1962-C5)-methyltransferase
MALPLVRLAPGHVQPLFHGHPWVFAQAIAKVEGSPAPGDEIRVVDPRGNFLGRGYWTPGSALAVRILVRDETTPLDLPFFVKRLQAAAALRRDLGIATAENTGYRLVHAEGDDLPGLVVDHFGGALVVQFLTRGMKIREPMLVAALREAFGASTIFERTPKESARLESFEPKTGPLWGDAPKEFAFRERGIEFRIPSEIGQKTGYYFDQRGLRARVESLSAGKQVLDCYSFVGSFSLAAARGGAASVHAVDASAIALETAAESARANKLDRNVSYECIDAKEALTASRGKYDLAVVDPPRLSPTRANRDQALAAYARVAELGARAVKPGGLLVFCSCSAAVDVNALTRALAQGATRANVRATVLERHFQGGDHPVPAAMPEGLYLKALIARIDAK